MLIPWQCLPADTLQNLIESFILREGTDYGEAELSLAEKRERLLQQLQNNHVSIFWSELHQTFDIKPNTCR